MGNRCGCCEDPRHAIYEDFLNRCDKGTLRYVEDALRLRKADIKRLMRVFHLIDTDESGSVSMDELADFIRSDTFSGENSFFKRIFQAMDVDREGKSGGVLDFSEFVMGLFNFCLLPASLLTKYMFSLYDTDNSGTITPEELRVMAVELFGPKNGQVQYQKMTTTLDANKDGQITAFEFVQAEKRAQSVLMPMMNLQFQLKTVTLGVMWWDWLQRKVYTRLKEERVKNVYELLEKFKSDEQKATEAREEAKRIQLEQMEEEKAQRAEQGLPPKVYDEDGNEMKEEVIAVENKKQTRDMMPRDEQVAESKAYWEDIMKVQQEERAFTAAKRPRHSLKMNELGQIDVHRPTARETVDFAKNRIEYVKYKYRIVDEDEEAIRRMEKERIDRWKARPPTVQAPEVDDEEEDDVGSLPVGRRRRRRSRDTGSSSDSSRRKSKEGPHAGGAGGVSSAEEHGDLVIQNIEDEAAG
mmetsp:Transcript_29562/g.68640  ORF Transcript_29562/g.68640 Transcript_29562/m.68640 type:complete len:468 (+) Transcript_29562:270-1673(+)